MSRPRHAEEADSSRAPYLPDIDDSVTRRLVEDMARAHAKHGPISEDEGYANAILVEEVGEASKEVVEMIRIAKTKMRTTMSEQRLEAANEYQERKQLLIAELIQVAGVALRWIEALEGR